MNPEKINIVITDDHNLFRKGIRALISEFNFVGEVYEAENGKMLLELLSKINPLPHIILLDLRMPEMDGMEAQSKIRNLYPDIKIIILTMEDDEQIILHMINEGVNGYLMKNAEPEELELALKRMVETDFYFSDDISGLVMRSFQQKKKNNYALNPELTQREIQVLELICKELTANEIADVLSLSSRTVEGHKRKLLDKTGTKNMAGLVVYALKNDLVIL
jgi:DNA-binding NarL/FixJ family response regulator